MRYTTLTIRNHNYMRKFILFYADYLQEAWLSEVNKDDSTKIIKQFKCKDTDDFQVLLTTLSRMGEIINLSSNQTVEQHLAVLEMKLEQPRRSKMLASFKSTLSRLTDAVFTASRPKATKTLKHA
jgi:hypothetical protein